MENLVLDVSFPVSILRQILKDVMRDDCSNGKGQNWFVSSTATQQPILLFHPLWRPHKNAAIIHHLDVGFESPTFAALDSEVIPCANADYPKNIKTALR